VLKVFVIYNNIDRKGHTLKIVIPNFTDFKNGQKFHIISVVIQLHKNKILKVKDNWMNFTIFIYNEKNSSESVAGDIFFHNELNIRDLVGKNIRKTKISLTFVSFGQF